MKAAIIIPARLESTRLPRKLLLDGTGKPLLAHTIERALAAAGASGGLISDVLCAVDHPELFAVAEDAGAKAVMTPLDCASGTDRIAIAARGLDCDIVVNLQGDEPEADAESLIRVARLLEGDDAPMGTLAIRIGSDEEFGDPSMVKVVAGGSGDALYFSRAPIPASRDGDFIADRLRHIGVYSYRREFLLSYGDLPRSPLEESEKLEQLRALAAGYRIRVAVVDSAPAGIDTAADYDAFVERCRSAG